MKRFVFVLDDGRLDDLCNFCVFSVIFNLKTFSFFTCLLFLALRVNVATKISHKFI